MEEKEILNKIESIISENGYIPHIYSEMDIYSELDPYFNKLVDSGRIRRIRKWKEDANKTISISGSRVKLTITIPNFESSYTMFEIGSGGITQIFYDTGSYDYVYSDEYNTILDILDQTGPITVSNFICFNPFRKRPEPRPTYSTHRSVLEPLVDPNTDFGSYSSKPIPLSSEEKKLGGCILHMIKNGILKDTINWKDNQYSANITRFYDAFSNSILEPTIQFKRDRKINELLS